jgi:hypothetical protein
MPSTSSSLPSSLFSVPHSHPHRHPISPQLHRHSSAHCHAKTYLIANLPCRSQCRSPSHGSTAGRSSGRTCGSDRRGVCRRGCEWSVSICWLLKIWMRGSHGRTILLFRGPLVPLGSSSNPATQIDQAPSLPGISKPRTIMRESPLTIAGFPCRTRAGDCTRCSTATWLRAAERADVRMCGCA